MDNPPLRSVHDKCLRLIKELQDDATFTTGNAFTFEPPLQVEAPKKFFFQLTFTL